MYNEEKILDSKYNKLTIDIIKYIGVISWLKDVIFL